jgi:hypothetical protein
MKRIAIFLGHPAHFHMFKNLTELLIKDGFAVDFLVKRKDILEDLVKEAGYQYYVVRKKERKSSSYFAMAKAILSLNWYFTLYVLRKRPDLMIGTFGGTYLCKPLKIPVITFNEDDVSVVPKFAKLSYPGTSAIMAPSCCDCGEWEYKQIKYKGFQKLSYLHPNQFTPDESVVDKYLGKNHKPYVLMRFSRLNAYHDTNASGISDDLTMDIIKNIGKDYDIYISSERPLSNRLEPFRLHINLLDIHHLMAFATLYVGDSQSMAVEASMLGVPNIRFNSFVGKIGVLNELESKYQLSIGISSESPQKLIETIVSLLSQGNLKDVYAERRKEMLDEKIDVTAFWHWFLSNYPESEKIIKENPDYQDRFK